MNLRRALQRLCAPLRKRSLEQELEAEVQAHLEIAEQEMIEAGVPAAKAREVARRQFGGIEQMKEVHRDSRSYPLIENLIRDFQYGISSLRKQPGFAAVTIAVLALGIGANTAMFSLVDALLWKPLPFPQPERMIRVWEAPSATERNYTTTLTYLDWKKQNSVFEALSMESPTKAAVISAGQPERLQGSLVSADYFRVFGVQAQLGRTFLAGEDQPDAAPVVVISHAVWQTRFGADPQILGRDLTLDGKPNRIVGVLPAGSFDRDTAGFWKPLVFAKEQMTRHAHWLQVVGRLRDGVSLQQAQIKMNALRAQLSPEMPAFKKNWTFRVEPFDQLLVGDTLRRSVYLGFGAVLLVLLITCANVANLLLAKGATRRKEMALRAALGASRGRLIAQLLMESLVLCLCGALAGMAIANFSLRAGLPLLSSYLPFTADVGLDLRVLAFAGAVALTVAILVGLLPSLHVSLGGLTESLNQSSRGSSGRSTLLRQAIVVGEVAVSLMLLCGASLLFKSLVQLERVNAGVRMDHVITMSADLAPAAYPKAENAAQFYRTVVEKMQAVPGVERAAVSQDLPLEGVKGGELFILPGVEEPLVVRFKRVDPQYFRALDIPVESGRGIEDRDRAGAPRILVINERLAQLLAKKYGMPNPVGKVVRVSTPGYGKEEGDMYGIEIAGVIRSERTGDLHAPQDLVIYVPLAQYPREDVMLIARTTLDPLSVVSGIREALREVDANMPLSDIRTMEQVKDRNLTWAKQPAWVIGAFAGVAALLAALGLYGVLSHSVTQRRREIGIRMALGASSRDVVSQVMGNAMTTVMVGLGFGLVGAFALTRLMKSLLFEVSPLDPVALIGACASMALIGLMTGFLPANRAARVNPVTTLREEG